MMVRRWKAAEGLTLGELLTVLMVIGVMTSVMAPAFWQMGLFSSDKAGESARELYALLRAARVYAAANNVRTALAYSEIHDAANRRCVNMSAMARELTPEELDLIFQDEDDRNRPWYVPLQSESGHFRLMLNGTCAFMEGADPFDRTEFGLGWLYICNEEGRPIWMEGEEPLGFYAHVFKPSGQMTDPSSSAGFDKQRFTVQVGLEDEADLPAAEFSAVPIELFASTGRVKIAD